MLHHIIADGWSLGVLMEDLMALYLSDSEQALKPLEIQYSDYAVWQREQVEQGRFSAQLAFWREQLAELPPPLLLPSDGPRPERQRFQGATWDLSWSEDEQEALQRAASLWRVSVPQLILAAWFIQLAGLGGVQDLCIGTPVANRSRTEVERVIGLFINTVTLRQRIRPEQPVADFVRGVAAQMREAVSHADLPFEQVVEALGVARQSASPPLYQVLFVELAPLAGRMPTEGGLSIEPLPVPSAIAQFDLSLYLRSDTHTLAATFEYNRELFAPATVAGFAAQLQRLTLALAEAAMAAPGDGPSLAQLSAGERWPRQRVAVIASFTAELLDESLSYLSERLGLGLELHFAPYAQVFQELLAVRAGGAARAAELVLLLLRPEDLVQGLEPGRAREERLLANAEALANLLAEMRRDGAPALLLALCPLSEAAQEDASFSRAIERAQTMLAQAGGEEAAWAVEGLAALCPYRDRDADRDWHIPYQREGFALLGERVVHSLLARADDRQGDN